MPDYVFAPDYKLRPLSELAAYIKQEQHLPEIPSAAMIKQQGMNLSEMQMQLLKKIEELTLYTIQQEHANTTQAARIVTLEQTLAAALARLSALEHGRQQTP
ncbi:MAG: hypothetical protein FJ147_24645 [Deltaproteobacteria bacterium]|nr:hypothetical protein [Deltaproteobacteria bacterium]